ncbi:hypothetical protein J3R74_000711 [Puniceicoccus vermicola]
MKYVNLTTMHHEGFHLYDTELSDFNSMAACGRDLVEEFDRGPGSGPESGTLSQSEQLDGSAGFMRCFGKQGRL